MAVVGTGLELASYGMAPEAFREAHGVTLIECPVERMPFADGQFDAVVMSHLLEHCHNIGEALREVRRVLADDGRLFIFVPPYTEYVCAGHVDTGWNIGQLLYVLLLNGFDVRQGRFIEYAGSVCAFVRKTSTPVPPLRGDRGDVRILADGGFLPLPVVHDQPPPEFVTGRNQAALVSSDAYDDGFYGHVAAIGWDADALRRLWPTPAHLSRRRLLLRSFMEAVPLRSRVKLASILERAAAFLRKVQDVE
jgi:SAM-dependent methyltransferase